MKDFRNDKLIKRNGRIGQIALFGGLLILVGGLVISIMNPGYANLSWLSLFAGIALYQIGLYFGNRWGRHPRPDELIDQGLKGLNDQYTIYHYMSPANHLLIGPAGMWVLVPYRQTGKIVYEKGRWKQKGGSIISRILRATAQEGIGRPDLEVPAEVQAVSKYLIKQMPDKEIPDPKSVLVFTSEKAELDVESAPIPSLPLRKLKETIRKSVKDHPLSPDMIKEINSLLYPI